MTATVPSRKPVPDAIDQRMARHEAAFRADPSRYRRDLVRRAVIADVMLTIVRALPLAAPILFGMIWFHQNTFFLGAGAIGIAVIVWISRLAFHFDDDEVARADAPALFKVLDEMRSELDVHHPISVHLSDDFNAAAVEVRGLFGVFGNRLILVLGVPLLCALTRDEALAVVAHEFGHFSRRHGRFGHWLYNARVGWMHWNDSVGRNDSPLDRAAAAYARRFIPDFSLRCFVHSRQCEYEADADAAAWAGAAAFARALARVAAMSRVWHDGISDKVASSVRAASDAPTVMSMKVGDLLKPSHPDAVHEALVAELNQASGPHDTHPALRERLRALGIDAAPGLAPPDTHAGEALLGEAWRPLLEGFESRWAAAHGPVLQALRLRHLHLERPSLAATDNEAARWSLERQLARATVFSEIEPARGLAMLANLLAAHPHDPAVRFAEGSARAKANDLQGVDALEDVARKHPAYRHAAFHRVLAFHARAGDVQQVERWTGFDNTIHRRVSIALGEFVRQLELGETQAAVLSPALQRCLTDIVAADPGVERAWMFEGCMPVIYAADRDPAVVPVWALYLEVQPNLARGGNDDEVATRFQSTLSAVLTPPTVPHVATRFATEPLPPFLRGGGLRLY